MGADGVPRTEPTYGLEIDARLPPQPWQLAAVADLTDDGLLDLLVWRHPGSGRLTVWRMGEKGQRLDEGVVQPDGPTGPDWRVVGAPSAANGSPQGAARSTDLWWQNAASGELQVWYLDPAGPPYLRTAVGPTSPAAVAPRAWVVGPR